MVFLDSPMAIRATEIFKKFPGLLNKGLREQMRKDDPFDFPGLTLSDKAEISRQIKKVPAPKVIVAGSGMMTGGRILHHVMEYISSPTTQIVFVGYQAEGTLGRQIIDGAKTVNIWGNERRVGAEIINIESMSAHADQGQLLNWVKKIWGVRKVVLVHGEEIPRLTLKEKINPPLLEQAVMNLLDNAINASADGKAIRVEAGEKETEVLVHVKDRGLGIEKGNLDRLFERFYRVDKARSRKRGGTGLGLAIVKHIMEAHKGRVTVESRPGAGSAFTLHLQKVSPEKIIQS